MKILFLCTANSCRSILAEALFNHLAPVGMRAFSAGSEPRGEINPLTLEALNPDFVITVCDKAAGEACPVHFGPATKAHWGLVDPSESVGSPDEIGAAFDATLARLKLRFTAFLALPLAQLDAATLRTELARIGTL